MIRNSPTLVDNLIKQNQDLETIQSELDVYVEEKRKVFPRFYFLSFEDLIQILSNSENKDVISLHLKTLFDGIVALEFKDENITKMFSKEKEVVELSKPVKTTRQPVEVWLLNLTEGMKETVYRKLKEGYKVYSDDTRKDWVLQQPGQVVASVA
jgi:dynein heavy chain